eukprot:250342_1
MLHSPIFRSESLSDDEFKHDEIPQCIKHPFITIHNNEELLSVLRFAKDSINNLYFEQYKYFNLTISLRTHWNNNTDDIKNDDIILCSQIIYHLSKYIKTLHIGINGDDQTNNIISTKQNNLNINNNNNEWNQMFNEIIKMCINYQLNNID